MMEIGTKYYREKYNDDSIADGLFLIIYRIKFVKITGNFSVSS